MANTTRIPTPDLGSIVSLGRDATSVRKRIEALEHVLEGLFTIPGTKRIAYAHEDTVWATVHGTHERDLDKIEAHFIAQSEPEFQAFIAQGNLKEIAPCHG